MVTFTEFDRADKVGVAIAVDNSVRVYGTPFYIQAGLPLVSDSSSERSSKLFI
jgi:hypothetical protein